MEEKIVLDKDTFKALSIDSRINMLKLLTTKNHTLSEISEALNLTNSTVKEHLDVLVKANLVKQLDEGRKWKYYKLTFKGKNFIEPREVKVFFAFIFSIVGALGAGLFLVRNMFNFGSNKMEAARSLAAPAKMEAADVAVAEIQMAAYNEPTNTIIQAELVFAIIFLVLLSISCVCAGYYFKKNKVIVIGEKQLKPNKDYVSGKGAKK